MAQQKKGPKSLDNLMMSYADLTSSSKGSSFKGPPMKEVKVNKPAGTRYSFSLDLDFGQKWF
jgi:hypothetical protein